MLTAAVLLAAVTVLLKGAGALLTRVPDPLARRLQGVAPALLAALVVSELAGDGTPQVGSKAAGVAAAVVLASLRAPLAACVVAGAGVAAVLRALS